MKGRKFIIIIYNVKIKKKSRDDDEPHIGQIISIESLDKLISK